jgi:hypothetical protein
MNPLDDNQLDRLLGAWQVQPAPANLNARIRGAYRRNRVRSGAWKWLISARLPVPTPVFAASLAVMLGLCTFVWRERHAAPPPPQTRVVVETRTVEVPVVRERVVVRTVYRDRPAEPARIGGSGRDLAGANSGYQFVTALTPRIERRKHVDEN